MEVQKKSVQAYVRQLAETYDTVGTTRTFQTYTGRYVEETGNRYGWAIDVEAETKGLREALASGKSQERTPEFSQVGAAYNKYGDIGYSYVEVDLSNQHVYLIVSGKTGHRFPLCYRMREERSWYTGWIIFGYI